MLELDKKNTTSEKPAPAKVSLWWVVNSLIIFAILSLAARSVGEVDVYWHILMGLDIAEYGRFTGNPSWIFSVSDNSWQTTQILPELLFAWLWETLGWAGIALYRMTLIASIISVFSWSLWVVVRRTRYSDNYPFVLFLFLFFFILGSPFWDQERPQLFSFLLYPVAGVLLLRFLYTGKWPSWWLLGVICVVWGWFHAGGLILAPILVGTFVVHRLYRKDGSPFFRHALQGVPVILAVLVAPMISPIGLGFYPKMAAIQDAVEGNIVEWIPPEVLSVGFLFWFFAILLWVYFAASVLYRSSAVSRRSILVEGTWLLGMFFFSLMAYRYVPVAFFLSAPLIARRVALSLPSTSKVWGFSLAKKTALIIVGAVTLFGGLNIVQQISAAEPISSTIRSSWGIWNGLNETTGQRNVIVDYNISGRTLAFTREGVSVSLDGRADKYGEWLDSYIKMLRGKPGWEETINNYLPNPTDALLEEGVPLIEFLENSGWTIRCTESEYVWLTAPGYSGECSSNNEGPSESARLG